MELNEVLSGDQIDGGHDDLGAENKVEKIPEPEIKAEPDEEKAEVKDEGQGEPTSPKTEVPLAALLDEREKRQRIEREREALQRKLQEQEKQKAKLDPLDDFDGAFNQRAEELKAEVDARFVNLTVNMAKDRYSDYDEMEAKFLEEAATNPSLLAEMRNSPNPAEYAYRHAKTKAELESAGDIETLREKIRREERERLMAELGKKEETQVPESLSDVRAAGSARDKVEGGPIPIENLFT